MTASTILPPYPFSAEVIAKNCISLYAKLKMTETPMAVGCPGVVIGILVRPVVVSLEASRRSGRILTKRMGPTSARFLAMTAATGWRALTLFETLMCTIGSIGHFATSSGGRSEITPGRSTEGRGPPRSRATAPPESPLVFKLLRQAWVQTRIAVRILEPVIGAAETEARVGEW